MAQSDKITSSRALVGDRSFETHPGFNENFGQIELRSFLIAYLGFGLTERTGKRSTRCFRRDERPQSLEELMMPRSRR
jgi:hypothetical protein